MILTVHRDLNEYLDGSDNTTVNIAYTTNDFVLTKDLKRGDIITIDFGINLGREKSGIRPAVVISNDRMNDHSQNVIVAPMTKYSNRMKGGVVELLPTQFVLSKKFYRQLKNTSIVQLEDIRSVSKKRVCGLIGNLSEKSMDNMQECLKDMFNVV